VIFSLKTAACIAVGYYAPIASLFAQIMLIKIFAELKGFEVPFFYILISRFNFRELIGS